MSRKHKLKYGSGVAFKVISQTPRAFPEEVGKGEKGDFWRGTVAILVLVASYLNKSIKNPHPRHYLFTSCPTKKAPVCCPYGWCIVFAGSRFCTNAKHWYAPIKGEAAAITWALEKCSIFIMDCPKIIVIIIIMSCRQHRYP